MEEKPLKQGRIVKVSGPLVVADGMEEAHMADVVRVGEEGLIGEILNMTAARASIQVYEDTSMLMPGAAVESTGAPLSAELGPGLLGMIYDGIQRPLPVLLERSGGNLARGVRVSALPREKKWHFVPAVQKGQTVQPGDVLGTVQETAAVEHRILTPVGLSGTVDAIVREGAYTVDEVIAVIDDGARREVTMVQRWPVRRGRPYREKLPPETPLATGQRVIDTLFPLAKGGTAAVPAPLAPARLWCSTSWPNGRTWILWYTLAAGSAATK